MRSNLGDLRLEHLSDLIALRLSGIVPWHVVVVSCMDFNYLFRIPKVSRPRDSLWNNDVNFGLEELKYLSDRVDPWIILTEMIYDIPRLQEMQDYIRENLQLSIQHYLAVWTNEAERNARVDYERRELIKLVMAKFETARREEARRRDRELFMQQFCDNTEEPYGDDMEGMTLEEWNQHVDRIISEWEQAE